MTAPPIRPPASSPPALRDRFLRALEDGDRELTERLAANLLASSDRLPGLVCAELGIPAGSVYAAAASLVLHRGAAARAGDADAG